MIMEAKPVFVSEAGADLLNADEATRLLVDLADAVPAIIAYVDNQLCYRFVNRTYERWWMLSRSEVVGRSVKSVLGPAFASVEEYLNATRRGKPQSFEYSFGFPDGQFRTVRMEYVPHRSADGKVLGLFVLGFDTSEEKLSHERLKKSERQLKGLIESSADAIISIDRIGTITHFSKSAEKMLGYTEIETIGKNVSFLMPEPYKSEHPGYLRSFQRTGKSKILGVGPRELKAQRKDGSIIPVELTLGEIGDDSGSNFVGHLRDISLRKKTLETLHDVGARLINIMETERKRIARELHDDLSQELALIVVELDLLGRDLPKRRSSIEQQLKRIQGMARDAASEVHKMSHQLHPAMLDQLGLASAVASFCNETSSRHETKVDFTDEGISRDVPADVSLNFYRILQEGIQNSLKHSGADKIEVKLYPDGRNICMTVSDEGLGFDPDSAAGPGLGLTSIEERARLIGANLEISSQPGKGTKIRVCKMLKQET